MSAEEVRNAKNQFAEIISDLKNEANRLTALVESRKISVPEYKRLMWEHLGISPHCLEEIECRLSSNLKPKKEP